MLDLQYVRKNLDDVEEALRHRGSAASLKSFRRLDTTRRELLVQAEDLKKKRNASSKKVGEIMRAGGDAEPLRAEMRKVGDRIVEFDAQLQATEQQLTELMHGLPNLAHESVPIGDTEADNRQERTWGEPGKPDFEPRPHWEIGTGLGILDFERAARMTGARFAIYLHEGARLERALIQLMLDLHTTEHDYVETIPPFMVNRASLFGTGQLPKFESDLFRTDPHGYYLIPTAEVPLTNLHADEILEPDALPRAYCAYTPCFRSEAGSYGKDVRGLIRQHQFNKVELVRFCKPQDSYDQLELLTKHAETVLQRLELPYRVMTLSSGDMGFAAAKTYDLEVWMPAQGAYREISSCSNCTDFQARRAKIRYKPEPRAKTVFCHTLNGSGLAVGRAFVAILENFQQADGSVAVPDALRPYMGGLQQISSRS